MRRTLLVGLSLVVAALAIAMLALPDQASHHRKVTVALADPTTTTEPNVVVCDAIGCPEPDPEPTTTTTAPVPVPDTTSTTVAPAPQEAIVASPGTTGARSYDWWYALAVCETGNNPPTDEPRTGYFGLEGGQPEGGRGWDAELAEAEGIYANYHDGAWGCAPVAWSNVPGG